MKWCFKQTNITGVDVTSNTKPTGNLQITSALAFNPDYDPISYIIKHTETQLESV